VSTQPVTFFFSYARSDADFVLQVARALRDDGVNVWIDQLDIPSGARWDETVENALRECSCLVVVMSPASVSSQNVLDEVGYALEDRKTVVPLLLAKCTIPFRLKRIQHVDFTNGYELGYKQLLAAVRRLMPPPEAAPVPEPVTPTPAPPVREPVLPADLAAAQLRRQRRVQPPRLRPAAPSRWDKPAAQFSRIQRAGPPAGPPAPASESSPPEREAGGQPGEPAAVQPQAAALPVDPVVPAPEPVVPTPEPIVPAGEPVAPRGPPVSPAHEPVAPPPEPDGSPGKPIQQSRQAGAAPAESPPGALGQRADVPRDKLSGQIISAGAAARRAAAAPAIQAAVRSRQAAAPAIQAALRSRRATPDPAPPNTLSRQTGVSPGQAAVQSRQGTVPASRQDREPGQTATQSRQGTTPPAQFAAQSRQGSSPTAPSPAQSRQGAAPGARPAAPPRQETPPAPPAGSLAQPDRPSRPEKLPSPPPEATPARHEEAVFYFEAPPPESPPAESPGPTLLDEAPGPAAPGPAAPGRRGWRYAVLGMAGLVAAGAAAYVLTPFQTMVDAWLAPEPPATAVAVAPGTSVGAGGQAAQIPASPTQEPVPPASTPEGGANAPAAVAEVTAGNQQPGVAKPAQDATAREAGKTTLKPDARSNKEKTVVASSDEPADDAVEKPAHGSSAAGTGAAGTATDEATPPQHAATDDAVQALVLRYIAAETSGNIEGLLSLYDDRVEFHQYKLAGHDYIRNYRQQFFEQWKKVETTLLGPIEINWSDTTTVNVTFVTSIHVVEPALDNPGETRNHLTLRVTNGGLKIVHEHQDVLKSPS
jgi:hypothetical protein